MGLALGLGDTIRIIIMCWGATSQCVVVTIMSELGAPS